jgi:prophage regulatory protein
MEQHKTSLKFIRLPQVKEMVGLSTATIWRLEKKGDFPKRKNISRSSVAWLLSDIENWITRKTQTSVVDGLTKDRHE